MWTKRVAALVAAVAMVAGAFWVRGRLDDDGPGGGPSAGTTDGSSSGRSTLLCARELAAACAEVAGAGSITVTVEDAATSVERLRRSEGLGADGWLTLAPLPELVDEYRTRTGLGPLFDATGEPLARSPLTLAVWNDRRAVLETRCAPITWRCVGDVAGQPWAALGGQEAWAAVKPAHADPAGSAAGLLVVSQAAVDWFGTTDIASIDLDANDEFRAWLRTLERAIPPSGTTQSPIERLLTIGPAAYDLVGAIEADAAPAVAASARRTNLTLLYPAPVVTADAVLAPAAGSRRASALAEAVSSDAALDALAAAGWRVDGRTLAAGLGDPGPLPSGTGLPAASIVDRLGSLVAEVTR